MNESKLFIKQILNKIFQKGTLTEEESYKALQIILSGNLGEATEATFGALFGGIMGRGGPTKEEVLGFIKAVLYYDRIEYFGKVENAIGIVGSGKDDLKTFNVSTGAAIVAAAAGAKIIKNGGRSESGVSGTTDVLEELGLNVYMDKEKIFECLDKLNITFVEAGKYFPRMEKYYIGRFLFINPLSYILSIASSLDFGRIVFGLASDNVRFTAEILKELGYIPSFVINGKDISEKYNIDEFSVIGPTKIAYINKNGEIEEFKIYPEDLGIEIHNYEEIAQRPTVEENAILLLKAISGRRGYGPTDIVAANAASALYLAGISKDLKDGVELALNIIEEGKAVKLLKEFVSLSGGDVKRLEYYYNKVGIKI